MCVLASRLTVLSPLVFATDLILLLWGEVILNVESLPNLFWRLALDHVRNSLAPNVKKGLDVHVVGGEDDLKKHLLVNLHELLVPILYVGGFLARIRVVVLSWNRVILVVLTPLEDLAQNGLRDLYGPVSVRIQSVAGTDAMMMVESVAYVHDWDWLLAWRTEIFDHVLDEHRALGDLALCENSQHVTCIEMSSGRSGRARNYG